MKVLMLTSSYPKFAGDVTAPFVESIAESLAARGHAVDVLLPHHPELRRPSGQIRFFAYRYAPSDRLSLWGYASSLEADVKVKPVVYALLPLVALALRAELSKRLTAVDYDVVHVHWVVPNAALVYDVVRAHRAPLVVSLHGSDVFLAERLWPARALARAALHAAGAVSACSSDLRERALRLGAAPASTRVVPYGVDSAAFAPRAIDPAFRARLGILPQSLLVVGVGRLVEKKGFAFLVEAAARARGVHVMLVGDGDLRGELEEQARRLAAPVTFLGARDREGVERALAEADVVAVPSVVDRAGNVDGLPNALLEALASGRPVVASAVAGIPDVIEHDVDGLLLPPGDAAALAAALESLARDKAKRERLGQAARRKAEDELSWPRAARAFEELYAEAAALDAR